MELVDTHCHIQSAGLEHGERATRELWAKSQLSASQLAERAREAGVHKLLCVGCDLADSELAVNFVQNESQSWASIGIHPHEAKAFAGQEAKLTAFAALLERPKVVAIGECGFDFFYTHSPKTSQRQVLELQLELARLHNLPVIFHVREAFAEFWPVFDNFQGLRGVLHSFTDTQENLHQALDRGLFIGVNGIATFTKNADQQAMYRAIPLENLLLETDAPFLTPAPYRGSINEPKHVRRVAEFLSELREEDLAVVAERSTANAQALFGI